MGVTFNDTVKNLTKVLNITPVSSTIDSDKWVGTSPDKSVYIEIFGKPEKVTESKFAIRVKLGKSSNITPENKNLLGIFLENVSPDWISRNKWLDEAIEKLSVNPNLPANAVRNDIIYELSVDSNNYLNLVAKPKPKSSAVEI